MLVGLSSFSSSELDLAATQLSSTVAFLRSIGRYSLASQNLAVRNEVNQHLLRREADHRQELARQLSLCPPGAYEQPA